ncbi:hypothetical protein A6U92_18605 [Agrobacterium rubi]|nr:hypothetical protein A6U92_18605 [Agrobacterium rubi]
MRRSGFTWSRKTIFLEITAARSDCYPARAISTTSDVTQACFETSWLAVKALDTNIPTGDI